jgi:uncharacterized protein
MGFGAPSSGEASALAGPFEAIGSASGFSISPRGAIALVHSADSVRQAILLLISTRPGERVMRPTYGCHLFRLAFAPNDDTTAGLAIHYVRQALQTWEPRIEVLRLDAHAHPDHTSRLDIHLQYRLRLSARPEHLSLGLELASGRVQLATSL